MTDQSIDERIAAPGTPRFNIGRVLAVALGVALRNFFPFLVISFLIAIPSFAISTWYQTLPVDPQQGLRSAHRLVVLLSMIVGVVAQAITQAALTTGTLQAMRGESVLISTCLRHGFRLVPKVAPAAILWWLMVSFSAMLLIVPGLIVATMVWLYVPVIVVENAGIIGSFGRSRRLTRGRRWQIFGLFLLVIGLYAGLEVFLITKFGLQHLAAMMHDPKILLSVSAVSLVLTSYAWVMTAVGYYYLRAEKEGIAIDDIARVFE